MKQYLKKFRFGWKLFTLLLLNAVTFSYAMFQGGFVSWFLFYSFIPFAGYSLLLSMYPIRSFLVKRSINQEQFSVGEKMIGTITVKRSIPFPLFYLIIEDVVPKKLKESEMVEEPKKLLFPWFKRTLTFQYVLNYIPRGEHHFSSIRVRTGDLFGLIEKEHIYEVENYFLVYPQYVDLIYRQQEKQFEQGSTSSRVKFIQDTTMAVGIREYQPGDRFSWIDWKATARRDSIMTKEFEQMQSHNVVIVMDRAQSVVFDQIVTFTASLVRAVLKQGAQVGFVSVGEDKAVFPLHSNEQHLQRIYYHLAKVTCDTKKSLSEVLEKEKHNWQGRQVTTMIITGQLTIDFVRRLELTSGNQQSNLVFLIKDRYGKVSNEEKVMIDRLRKQRVYIKVIFEGQYANAFKEASCS